MWFNQSNQKIQNRDSNSRHQKSVDLVASATTYISIIWIQDGSNQVQSYLILEAVKALDGVREACFADRDATILMIDFAPDETRAKILQAEIHDLGIMAKIIELT